MTQARRAPNKYQALYKNYFRELRGFEEWLKTKPWEVTRYQTFRLAVMDEILFAITEENIDEDDIAVLLDKGISLWDIVTSNALSIKCAGMIQDSVSAVVREARLKEED